MARASVTQTVVKRTFSLLDVTSALTVPGGHVATSGFATTTLIVVDVPEIVAVCSPRILGRHSSVCAGMPSSRVSPVGSRGTR